MPNRPSEIQWEVKVDWDATDWAVEPNFDEPYDDISNDVNFNGWQRGKNTEEGNIPSGTHEIKLKAGLCAKYSIYNTLNELHDKIRPWLPIRIRALHNETPYPIFKGYIASIKVDPRPDKQMVYLYVTDGADLLARQIITQDYDNRQEMSDGEAVNKILDAAGWSYTQRDIDLDGGSDLLNYPETGVY